jgi:type IV pilus assembly protein PilB
MSAVPAVDQVGHERSSGVERRLGEYLLLDGLITVEQLSRALERQRGAGGFLGSILVELGYLTPAQLQPFLEQLTGFPFIELAEFELDPVWTSRIPESYAISHQVIVLGERNGCALVAMADPVNVSIIDDLRTKLQMPIQPLLVLQNDVKDAITRAYDVRSRTKELLAGLREEVSVGVEDIDPDSLADQAERAPIVRLVTEILSGAVTSGASDIHIEPQRGDVRVRYRVDGVLFDQMTIPKGYLAAAISRLKVMAKLNIAERRRPQDGRFSIRDDRGAGFDVRLSLVPTVNGEKACMRLLEKSNSLGNLDRIGLLPSQRPLYERFITKPHGLVLVTGPTGSGKSTTLYAALQHINTPGVNISTVEDPVEYELDGVNQIQVNPTIDVTFSAGLRSLVRQDPDVILVGEIRDRETAEIAIQAALTGHLVLSTLHTNDAVGAVTRLENMGVEPFLIASALVGVVGQRLLRTICTQCKENYTPERDIAIAAGVLRDDGTVPLLARGAGCKRCGNRGSKGRTAVMEVLQITEGLRAMILEHASEADITRLALKEGLITMRQAAAVKANYQLVTPEEILRVFAEDI